jgi:hypothetical protein
MADDVSNHKQHCPLQGRPKQNCILFIRLSQKDTLTAVSLHQSYMLTPRLSSESQPFEGPISNEIFISINPNNLSLRSFTRHVSKLPQSQSDGYNCCSITSTSSEDRCCRMQYNRTLLEPKWDLLILKWLFCICSGLLDQCSSGV